MARPAKVASPKSNASTSYVALLRGINVGGKNMLPMARLAAIFADAGCADVRTYIQSGNVVFSARPAAVTRICRLISERIDADFGFQVPVVLRAADELRRVTLNNPFLGSRADDNALHVAFLAEEPESQHAAALDPKRSPGDSFLVRGREVFLHLPNGVGKTKLTNAYLDSRLKTTSTVRNWRTVLKLHEMAHATS